MRYGETCPIPVASLRIRQSFAQIQLAKSRRIDLDLIYHTNMKIMILIKGLFVTYRSRFPSNFPSFQLSNDILCNSSDILEDALVDFVSLNVASFDKRLDSKFNLGWLWVELHGEDSGCFGDEVYVLNLSAGLHNLDDRGFNRVPPIVFYLSLHLDGVRLF